MAWVQIVYGQDQNNERKFQELYEAIWKASGIQATRMYGSPDCFEVTVNGELCHSKRQTGKLPDTAQVVKKVKSVKSKEPQGMYQQQCGPRG